jgi:hypothetical protein
MASVMRDVDGEGIAWGVAGSAASVLVGLGLAADADALAASPPLRSYDADAGHRS